MSESKKLIDPQVLRELHRPSWAGTWLFAGYLVVFFAGAAAIIGAVAQAWWLAVVPLMVIHAFAMHAFLVAFHEASHGNLCPWPSANEVLGRLVGGFGFMSLTLYRAAHHWHHAFIGDPVDEEFWPMNDPAEPLWKRRLFAFLELTVGLAYTPLLFFRSFARAGHRIPDRRTRTMIWVELAIPVLFLGGLFVVCLAFGYTAYYLAAYLVPAWIAGNLQSLRKYVEHIGLVGADLSQLTRSVRDPGPVGRGLAFLLFNEPFHDMHHRYPRLPQEVLNRAAQVAATPPELPLFPNYRAAFWDMLRTLHDPRFGTAWVKPAVAAAVPLNERVA